MRLERLHGLDEPFYAEAWVLYNAAFPANERRNERWHAKALREKDYYMCAAVEDGRLCGIAFFWLREDAVFLEHLAVEPALRGKGLGTKLLDLLRAMPGRLILEIEKPVDERTRRRQRFYERAGLRLSPFGYDSPSYQAGQARCPLQLMCEDALTEELFAHHCRLMTQTVLACTDGHDEPLAIWNGK